MEKQEALALMERLAVQEFGLFPASLCAMIREKRAAVNTARFS